jgi:hypothetical protein
MQLTHRRHRWAVLVALPLLAVAAACTPQQAGEWLGWHKHDSASAGAWLASPDGQQSLTDPSIDVPAPEAPAASWSSGDCASFADEAAAAGLPWGTFSRIAWRESGCNPNSWVVDRDDDGGGLFGLNFKGQNMKNYWAGLCGATTSNIRGNVTLQMECAAAEYHSRGLRAWS